MTPELVLVAVTLLLAAYYAKFVLAARKGLFKLQPPRPPDRWPSVSVIIAARDEQETIAQCLRSALDQDYPRECMEVILVNDGSTDNSGTIAEEIASQDSKLKVVHMSQDDGKASNRKPAALARGILEAKGDIILTTDGDCIVTPNWIRSMAAHFDDETVFVAGPVQELTSSTLISKLSQLEFLGLIGIAAGLIANGNPIICNGANIAFRRKSYGEVNGFGDSGFCDDEVLLQRMRSRRIGRIQYSIAKESIVSTPGPGSVQAFWNQRIRWASKRGHYEDKSILSSLVGLYLAFLFLSILFVTSLFLPDLFLPFLALLGGKLLIDYAFLRTAGNIFGLQVHPLYFCIAQLLHVPYIVAAAFAGQFSSLEWKGHQIRR